MIGGRLRGGGDYVHHREENSSTCSSLHPNHKEIFKQQSSHNWSTQYSMVLPDQKGLPKRPLEKIW